MKLLFVLLGLLPLALGAQLLKSVVITFPKNTPTQVIDEAKASIRSSVRRTYLSITDLAKLTDILQGGTITHEYRKSYIHPTPFQGIYS